MSNPHAHAQDTQTQPPGIHTAPPLPRGMDPEMLKYLNEHIDARIATHINAAKHEFGLRNGEQKKLDDRKKLYTNIAVGTVAAGIGIGGTLVIQRWRRGAQNGM